MISDFVAQELCSHSRHARGARRPRSCRWVFAAAALLLILGPGAMLVKGQGGYLTAIGVPTFSASVPIENGFINVANGNLHLEIPLGGSFPQRGGGSVRTALLYDSAFWMCCGGSGSWA